MSNASLGGYIGSENAVTPGGSCGCGSVSGDGGGNGSGGVASDSGVDGDDQDDSSSSSQHCVDQVGDALASFREQWQRELENTVQTRQMPFSNSLPNEEITTEGKAKSLFLKGVENEQAGKLYEAIQYYRKAVQLVPDIEFKLYESSKPRQTERNLIDEVLLERDGTSIEHSIPKGVDNDDECCDDDDDDESNLLIRLQRYLNKSRCVCQPEHEQKATHISELPLEIMLYILRWVVSSELDLRSLEMCSQACRGLFVCCRDPEIWRLACVRVWGLNCGGLSTYSSWREMFISRPRLHFNGCYISKTTYLRNGENSFQDQFYRPWQMVEYYRYLRFFPEGKVLMLTTPEDPLQCLNHLRTRSPRHQAILAGHYCLRDERVTIVLQRQDLLQFNKMRSRKNVPERTSHLELSIVTYRTRKHAQLIWTGYSIRSVRQSQETISTFELGPNRFPPFWFSRVKSYTTESEVPLM